MAFARGPAARQRFSLLLLEPGEIYFDDVSLVFYPDATDAGDQTDAHMKRKSKGRLMICSKSLVFEPQDTFEPLIKFAFKDCTQIAERSRDLRVVPEVFGVTCERVQEMRANNVIAPYVLRKGARDYRFSLNFVALSAFLPRVLELFSVSKMPIAQREKQWRAKLIDLQRNTKFDPSWLVDLHEHMILEMAGSRVTPLVHNPGRIMITTARIYFQPFNNVDPDPVTKFALRDVTRLVRRRHMLRQIAVEIFLTGNKSIMFSFSDRYECDQFLDTVKKQPELFNLEQENTENVTVKWQNGQISNYDYLMYLNSLADRTFNDLTQYPVFPWVISNYTSSTLDLNNPDNFRDLSKPIGALDAERLKTLKARYKEMPEPKFLYGTHYSTPGYVLYYLVRLAPEYMLCLQNGKFDAPDRLFHSIAATWENVLTNPSDVKELIPEFYQSVEVPEDNFLLNSRNLDLGVRQNQGKVNDVVLPPWATDARDFLNKNRAALESDVVSRNLHKWIDLIFGYKQRGEEAIRADNLFYYLTYEGAIDIEAISDPAERAAIELQISEFGQTPKQLFRIPHPRRLVKDEVTPSFARIRLEPEPTPSPPPLVARSISAGSAGPPGRPGVPATPPPAVSAVATPPVAQWRTPQAIACLETLTLHKDAVTAVCLSADGDTIFSVSQDSSLKIYSRAEKRQLRSVNVSELALSAIALSKDGRSVFVSSWDNNVYVYNVDYGRILDTLSGHDDAVSSIRLRESTLVTASWDSTIKVWECPAALGDSRRSNQKYEFGDHESEVKAVDLSADRTKVVSGSKDGSVLLWTVGSAAPPLPLGQHADAVSAVAFTADGKAVISAGADGYVKMFNITGTERFASHLGVPLRCLLSDGRHLFVGCETGELKLLEVASGMELKSINAHQAAVTCIEGSSDGTLIVTGGEDATVKVWRVS